MPYRNINIASYLALLYTPTQTSPEASGKNEGWAIHDTPGISSSHTWACGQLELTYANRY